MARRLNRRRGAHALCALVAFASLVHCRTPEGAHGLPSGRAVSEPSNPPPERGAPVEPQRPAALEPSPEPPSPSERPEISTPEDLPAGIEPGKPVVVAVPGDTSVEVIHGAADTRRAIVYLHGVCGNVGAIHPWAETVSRWGTLVAVMGDRRCGGSRRYKWTQDTVLLDQRIDRALAIVAEARAARLDTEHPALVGYSQGATRAASLVERFPEKYSLVLLAGTPVEPRVDRVGAARRVVVMGGENEPTAHMKRGYEALVAAGKNAKYLALPGASHGEFGPEAPRVMDEAFRFLFALD